MAQHLYPNFLSDPEQYKLSVEHWERLWSRTVPSERVAGRWKYPWLSTGSPSIQDGNPIFSAFSQMKRRGIRIIQHEPTEPNVEIQVWLDRFGGSVSDPGSIEELVICCALSDIASDLVLSLMNQWIKEGSLYFTAESHGLAPTRGLRPELIYGESYPFAA